MIVSATLIDRTVYFKGFRKRALCVCPVVGGLVAEECVADQLKERGCLVTAYDVAMSTNEELHAAKDARYDAGIQVRRDVMGDEFVDAALARNAGSDGEELQKHVTATVWGSVWTREGLSKRDRSLLNIGMLVALRATEELRGHVKGGLTNGLTREEITEAIIHASGYCGAPAALSAMKVAQEVLVAELGPKNSED